MAAAPVPASTALPTYWHRMPTPIGPLVLAGTTEALTHVEFMSGPRAREPRREWIEDPRPLRAARTQLQEYFAGERRVFQLVLAPQGTPFQRMVWRALRAIPYGQTLSYGELARRLGHAHGARAVGLANGANPLPVIVPCHRVIGADGTLTGFGGGLPIKHALLALEGADCVSDLFSGPAGRTPTSA